MIIETKVYSCRKCQSEDLVKNGANASGSSQYHCKACGAYGVLERKPAVIAAKTPVGYSGIAYRLLIKKPSFSVIIGARIEPSFQSSNSALWVKKRGKRLILSVGIIPYGNSWHASRKTLSFSKCVKMHEIRLKLFIHRYNTELLPIVG